LPVLVDGRDPIARRACHAGQGRGMLSVIPGQPHGPHKRILGAESLQNPVGPVRTAVVDEQDFVDHEAVPAGRSLLVREWLDLPDQRRERLLAAVNRDHQGNAVRGTTVIIHGSALQEIMRVTAGILERRQHASARLVDSCRNAGSL